MNIRIEKFNPRDDIGCGHIEVKFDREFAHIRVVSPFRELNPAIAYKHHQSLHRVIKIGLHWAHKNKVDLVALISEKYERNKDIFY